MAHNSLLEKLETLRLKFEEVEQQITDPAVIADQKRYVQLNKEYKELQLITKAYKEYKNILNNISGAKQILDEENDEELRDMAKMEVDELQEQLPIIEEKIKLLLIPKDPQDDKNAILEIRAGTGGDEASLFAGEIYRMYVKYCEQKNWKISTTSYTEGTQGGYKEIIATVTGEGVYGILKYESGVHRVQRVPQTETQGRVHTSAATVAVLPEADEFDVDLNMNDVRKDTYCSSGPGGQSVNTTYSAIRLTHIPTGIIVTCQDEKSQLKNLDKAIKELRSRLYNLEYEKYINEISSQRKTLVSTGDRSAKIRTYNYPQGRVTDHRINFTLYNLPAILDGDIQEFIDKLIVEENAERLKASDI
ncbi:MAG: peptide chain release factor 1 [Bacteroidales bacterium]|nr:peptide chain release factor 1 [Bacteroidales bacterium]NLK81782.1 peptide chain release factor 1 [Bacteroidales bacterium]